MAISTINQKGLNAPLTLTSPVLTTPNLGTPSAINLSNATALPKAALPAGCILQIVQGVKTDAFTGTALNTWTDITGMSATITPTSASSRVMIEINMFGVFWRMGQNGVILRMLKNGSNIGGGDAAGSRSPCIGTSAIGGVPGGGAPDAGVIFSYKWVDSPASTSALTYKIQYYQDTPANPMYVNRTIGDADSTLWPRTLSTIILTEIAG